MRKSNIVKCAARCVGGKWIGLAEDRMGCSMGHGTETETATETEMGLGTGVGTCCHIPMNVSKQRLKIF